MSSLDPQEARLTRDAMILIGEGMRKLMGLSSEPEDQAFLQQGLRRLCLAYLLRTLPCADITAEALTDFLTFDAVAEERRCARVMPPLFTRRRGRPKKQQ